MVISLCAHLYAKRIFSRNLNILFLMKKVGKRRSFFRIGENRGISQEKGNHRKKGEDCAPWYCDSCIWKFWSLNRKNCTFHVTQALYCYV